MIDTETLADLLEELETLKDRLAEIIDTLQQTVQESESDD